VIAAAPGTSSDAAAIQSVLAAVKSIDAKVDRVERSGQEMNAKVDKVGGEVAEVKDAVEQSNKRLRFFSVTDEGMVGREVLETTSVCQFLDLLPSITTPSATALQQALAAVPAASLQCFFQPKQLSETDLQPHATAVLDVLTKQLNTSGHMVHHETANSGYLTHPEARIDNIWTLGSVMVWSELVLVLELKSDLHSTSNYHVAIGQLVSRMEDLLVQQPDRKMAVGIALGCEGYDVWVFVRGVLCHAKGHTGIQTGWDMLAALLAATPQQLGYQAPVILPSSVDNKMFDQFHVLQHGSIRQSWVFRAIYHPPLASSTEDVVFKVMPMDDSGNEERMLQLLQAKGVASGIPSIVKSGTLQLARDPNKPETWKYLAMRPLGEHLRSTDPVQRIASCFRDVAQVMLEAYMRADVLHRDISHGNIVVHGGRGYLVDWHIAEERVNITRAHKVTGTMLYCSIRSHDEGHVHEVYDDIESLYYVLVAVLTGEKLHWGHGTEISMRAMKYEALMDDGVFKERVARRIAHTNPVERGKAEAMLGALREMVMPLHGRLSVDSPSAMLQQVIALFGKVA